MEPVHPHRPYYPALDGLRGLAILLVVVYHNFGFIDYFFFGWLGVDLFFVLSGFLITDILVRTVGEKRFLRNFYLRRVLRIFPLYYLALAIFLLVIPNTTIPLDLDYYTEHQVWLWTYMQNWLYIFNNPGQTTTLNHLWSLAVEEQFYLLWPLVILAVRKPQYLLILISFLLVAVLGLRLWIWSNQVTDLAYFNLYTFSRIDGICIGCMVALLRQVKPNFLAVHTTWVVLTFAGFNFIFFFINRRYGFSFPYLALVGYTTFAMIFGLLVNDAVEKRSRIVQTIFTMPVLKFFGRISYGFYIFHWPVYLLALPALEKIFTPYFPEPWLRISISVVATLIAILISWVSYRYYERYFLSLKSKFA